LWKITNFKSIHTCFHAYNSILMNYLVEQYMNIFHKINMKCTVTDWCWSYHLMSHRISKESYAPPVTHKDGSSLHVLLLDTFLSMILMKVWRYLILTARKTSTVLLISRQQGWLPDCIIHR
jgi:hypothetical protein